MLVWAGAPLPLFRPSRQRRAEDAGAAHRAHEDRVRARRKGTAAALPPRKDDRDRRPRRVRRRDRPHLRVGRPLRHQPPSAARERRLARRLRADRGSRGRRRRRALPHALARGDRRDARPGAVPPRPAGDVEVQIVRTVPERSTRAAARATSASSSPTCARSRRPSGSSTSRTSSSGHRRSRRSSTTRSRTRRTPTFGCLLLLPSKPNSGADDTRGVLGDLIEADARRRPAPRLHALRPLRAARRPDLHPREDRDRRRQLAHARLGEPQRALALQRHRDEHRHPRPRTRPRHAPAPLGRAPRAARSTRSRPTRSKRSTSSGNRSARSSSNDETPASRSPTASSGSRTSRDAPAAALGPLTGLLVDG